LSAGTYYVPINSTLEDDLGPYQLHIIAEACPLLACCLPDGSCIDGVNQFQCDLQDGTFLGPPTRFPSVPVCTGSTCASGSCCTGPGECIDEQSGDPISKAECDTEGGNYKGGVRCEGGECVLNPAFSCDDAGDCSAVGGTCSGGIGGQRALAQPNPCPICEFESVSSCQLWDDPGHSLKISDLGTGSGLVWADDFIAGAGLTQIDQVCTYGHYLTKVVGETPPDLDCGEGANTIDAFRVRILPTGANGLPDAANPVGTRNATSVKAIIPGSATKTGFFEVETYGYQLTLSSPITGLVPGTRYWLEIANDLPAVAQCTWNWSIIRPDSPQGNRVAAAGSDAGGYTTGGEKAQDLAWCINGAIETPAADVRPNCACDGNCFDGTLQAGNAANADYQQNAVGETCGTFTCPASGIPANDVCANATPLAVGTVPISTHCSTTDGFNPVHMSDTDADDPINLDVWFEFIPVQNCTLRVDMCNSGTFEESFDSALAVYSNGTSTCPCPVDQATHNATFIDAQDETCGAGNPVGGPAKIEVQNAVAGVCYMIRVGNWGPGGTDGRGVLDVSCGAPVCGDNSAQAANGEECDGIDDAACGANGSCNPPGDANECQCAVAVCGNNVREGAEVCDGSDDDACPGLCLADCTCNSVCGNGTKEGAEECDGPADASCGGVAGRCLVNCTCPLVVCGNGFKDPNEECDPGTASAGDEDDDACPGECRAAGDPAGDPPGGCTCRCGAGPSSPDPPTAEPVVAQGGKGTGKPRHISFVVPASSAGTDTALRVKLTSLHHPTTPPPNTPNFAAFEGQFRYVTVLPGNVTTCPDSANFGTTYRCATLACQPDYRDWGTLVGGQTLHVAESAIVPSSTYHVANLPASCGSAPAANTCSNASTELAVSTSRWGDVVGAGNSAPDNNNNVLDISTVVDKVKDLATAFYEPRCWAKQKDPNGLGDSVNVIDIGFTVDGVKTFPYPASFTIDACP
jgi:hypothetical protein